jgi:response regulator RpfG family c-di-GMP phosphodiesterase
MSVILIVDDEPSVREVMARLAEQLGHEVRQAANSDEAMDRMAERAADVAVCDVSMPGRDGMWLAGQLRDAYPDTAVIMATANRDADVALSSLRLGAVGFLAKPFGRELFREAIARGVRWHRETRHGKERLDALQREVADHLSHLEALFANTPVTSDAELERMLDRLIPDQAAVEHARRVATLATNMALSMGIRSSELADIQRAALLHDLGRAATPWAIVCKATPLSDEEIAIVRQQPRLVSQILARIEFLASAASLVGAIFEHVDGTGYPWALRGDEIPRGARIIAVADAHDAITHSRVHREARAPAEAIFEIHRCRGTQFEPEAVDALLNVVRLHWATATRRPMVESGPADSEADPPVDVHDGSQSAQATGATSGTGAGRAPDGRGVDGSAGSAPSEDTASG